MELTRHNFDETFPKFLELLRTCDFYSFDLEMTGINVVEPPIDHAPGYNPHDPANIKYLRKPADLFASKWAAASTFSPMQIGVSLFHRMSLEQRMANARTTFSNQQCTLAILDGWMASRDTAWARTQIAQQTAWIRDSMRTQPPKNALNFNLQELQMVEEKYTLLTELKRLGSLLDEAEKEIAMGNEGGGGQSYRATTFSAHLFPSHFFGDGEIKMSIETTGTFLSTHHMDFNAWVRNSLLFTTREQLAAVRMERLLSGGETNQKTKEAEDAEALATMSPSDQHKMKHLFTVVEQFARDNAKNRTATLPNALPFLADTLHQELVRKLKSLGLKATKGTVSFVDVSAGGSTANLSKASSNNPNDILRSETHQGTRFMEALIASRKPVVVHNSWSDLAFFYRALHSTPLNSYVEFKHAIRQLFPVLFDTRTLTTLPCMTQIGRVRGRLDATFQMFQKQPSSSRIQIEEVTCAGTPAVASTANAHDAGFDAFQTGALYLYAIAYAKAMRQSPDSISRLQGVIPVYASIFSIQLGSNEQDLLIHPRNMPVLVGFPDRPNSIAFASIVEKLAADVGVQAVVMNAGDAAVVYVMHTVDSDSIVRLIDSFIKRFAGTPAKLVDLRVSEFVGQNPDVVFF